MGLLLLVGAEPVLASGRQEIHGVCQAALAERASLGGHLFAGRQNRLLAGAREHVDFENRRRKSNQKCWLISLLVDGPIHQMLSCMRAARNSRSSRQTPRIGAPHLATHTGVGPTRLAATRRFMTSCWYAKGSQLVIQMCMVRLLQARSLRIVWQVLLESAARHM